MTVWNRDNRSREVDRPQDRSGPITLLWWRDRSQRRTTTPTYLPPRVEVRRKLAFEEHDRLSGPHRNVRRGEGDAVARSGHDRDAVRIPVDQSRKERPQTFCGRKPVCCL